MTNSNRLIAGLETSCDETSFSLIEVKTNPGATDSWRLLCHEVHTQSESHTPFGGVVPEIAARDHLAVLPDLVRNGFKKAGRTPSDLTDVAATAGPGLIGAVMVGYTYAQGLSQATGARLRAINHVDAHLAPAILCPQFDFRTEQGSWLPLVKPVYPRLSLTVSGGHCLLTEDHSPVQRRLLGTTLDDACGEAFDKVAKLLGLGYPGGPAIESLALRGDPTRFRFSLPLSTGPAGKHERPSNPLPFSFSGLKTSVLRAFEALEKQGQVRDIDRADLAAGFQSVAIAHLMERLSQALERSPAPVRQIAIAGGVAANNHFRAELKKRFSIPVQIAPLALCSDNATMIALQALLHSEDGDSQAPFARYPFSTLLWEFSAKSHQPGST